MENTTTVAIITAAISGAVSAWIVSMINMAMAKDSRRHELKLKKASRKRLDNQKISLAISEIKVSLSKIESFSRQYVFDRCNYYRAFYAQKIRKQEMIDDSVKLKSGTLNEGESADIKQRIKLRKGAIQRSSEEIKLLKAKGDETSIDFNTEIWTALTLLSQLSFLSGKDLTECEDLLRGYFEKDFYFVDFNKIEDQIRQLKKIDDLNAYMPKEKQNITNMVDKGMKDSVQEVRRVIRETNFKLV